MFDYKHYVPILKWRQAEQLSLKDLDEPTKSHVTPLIEIPNIPWDYAQESPAKTINQHLSKVPEQLCTCWGASAPMFLDMGLIPSGTKMKDGRHPLKFVFDETLTQGVKLIPVTGISRADDYQSAIQAIASQDREICLRLREDDFGDDKLLDALKDFFRTIGIRNLRIDLVLDFEDIAGENIRRLSRYMIETIREINEMRQWRTLTFAASSFPKDLSVVPSNSIETFERKEWEIWKVLASSSLPRKPSFGDYAIQHPVPSEIDPRIMMMSASVRYTLDSEWLILKARSVRRHGSEQYHSICTALANDSRFYGRDFSWGDQYIVGCANKTTGPGNATTWRHVGTIHHIKLVCEQIANFRGI